MTNSARWYWSQVLDQGRIPPAARHVEIAGGRDAHSPDGRVRVIVNVEPFLRREE